MKKDQKEVPMLSAFADISGSGAYRQRATDERKQVLPFWQRFDSLVDDFEIDHEYLVRHLGDGFLCNVKLNEKNGVRCQRFLTELWNVRQKIERLINRSTPGPDGIRIHIAAGDAIETVLSNGEPVFHGYHLDLIGTSIKMDAFRQIPFVVHKSVIDLMSPIEIERARFIFESIPAPEIRRASEKVYEKDLGLMTEFKKR